MAIAPANIEVPDYDPYVRPWAMRYARERVGLSLEDAAERLAEYATLPWADPEEAKVTPELVAAWEAGTVVPDRRQRPRMCRIYMYPNTGFWSDEPIEEPMTDFRSAPDGEPAAISYETHVTLDEFARFYDMAEEVAIGPRGELEATSVPYAGSKTVEQLASEIRSTLGATEFAQRSWRVADATYCEWKRRVECSGVFVFTLPLDIEQVRGASRWDPDGPPTILVSTQEEPAERVLTLLHEYAHLTHRREPSARCDPRRELSCNPTERRMNQIAMAALLPEDWLQREVNGEFRDLPFDEWPAPAREALTRTFGVDGRVLAARLADIGLAERSEYARCRRDVGWSSMRSSMTDAERYMDYLGEPMVKLLRAGAKRGGVTIGETAKKWVRIDTAHLDQILYDDAT